MIRESLKKSLSLLLSVCLLLSLVLVAAPAATAAATDKYSYQFQLITENNADCNDHDHPVLMIYGKTLNGTGAEEVIYETELDYDYIQSKKTFTCSGSIDKFPTKVFLSIDFDGGGWRKWEGKFKLSVNDTFVINDTSNRTLSGANMFSHELKSMSVEVNAQNYPVATKCAFTKKPPANVTVPRQGEPVYTCDIDAELTDQYGVLWHEKPTISFENYHNGVAITDGKLTIGADANSADGSNTNVKINAAYSTLSAAVSLTLTNAAYTYTFRDEEGNVLSTGSLRSGQVIPKPEDLKKESDRSNHYIFTGWNPSVERLSKDTVFTPIFKQEAHQFLTYTSDKNATCTKDGTKTAQCTCGVEKTVADEGSALGHSYTYEVTKEPDCTEKGTITYTCIRGDHSYTQEIAAKGHSYTAQTVAPTCTEQGYTLYTCSACNDTYRDSFTAALEHNWDSGNIKKAAGCTESGEKVYTCARCHETRSEEIEPLGHSFKVWTIRSYASCTEDGSKFSTCSRCKEVVNQTIPAFGHSWSEWEQSEAPQCESDGKLSRYCQICGTQEYDSITALGHEMVEKTTPPADGKPGMIYYECARGCGKCATCVISAGGERQIGEICTPEALEASTVDIPAPHFNSYNSVENEYDYHNRGASLRVDKAEREDVQAMRFAASVLIPDGAQIEDFGYIYTRSDYFKQLSKFVLGGANVYSTSVKSGKYSCHTVAEGEVRTFNIVLSIDRDNWSYDYLARPYIVYTFAGETFTVYDEIYASRSVDYVAQRIVDSPLERADVKAYIQAKILDR